jgi:hypothetical protein
MAYAINPISSDLLQLAGEVFTPEADLLVWSSRLGLTWANGV